MLLKKELAESSELFLAMLTKERPIVVFVILLYLSSINLIF